MTTENAAVQVHLAAQNLILSKTGAGLRRKFPRAPRPSAKPSVGWCAPRTTCLSFPPRSRLRRTGKRGYERQTRFNCY